MYTVLHVKYRYYSCQIKGKKLGIFSTNFRKILKHQILPKSVLWEPSFFMPTDRQTYMTKLAVAFRKFFERV